MSKGKAWDKEKVIELLKPKFQLGYSIRKACEGIGLNESTFATWLQADDMLRSKVVAWQSEISDTAVSNLRDRVVKKDSDISKWWLERKEKEEFGQKIISDNTNLNINTEVTEDNDRARIIRGAIEGLKGEKDSK